MLELHWLYSVVHKSLECPADCYRHALHSKVASGIFKRQRILSKLMAVVSNGQKMLATYGLFKTWKMLCATTAELQCHDLGPHRWPPQTAPADRPAVHHAAGTQSAVRCSGGGPDAHVTSCVCGAARNTRFPSAKVALTHRRVQHSRGPPLHRLTRSQKTRISAEIHVLRSAALPSTAVSRALARNTPSC